MLDVEPTLKTKMINPKKLKPKAFVPHGPPSKPTAYSKSQKAASEWAVMLGINTGTIFHRGSPRPDLYPCGSDEKVTLDMF